MSDFLIRMLLSLNFAFLKPKNEKILKLHNLLALKLTSSGLLTNTLLNFLFYYLKFTIPLQELSQRLRKGIESKIEDYKFNGDAVKGYPGCVNYSFACVEGESLMVEMNQVAFSSGSACTSASLEPSYVLRALGVGDDLAHCSARFGISKFSTGAEIEFTVDKLTQAVRRLRAMSPLWEMKKEGVDLSTINWN